MADSFKSIKKFEFLRLSIASSKFFLSLIHLEMYEN